MTIIQQNDRDTSVKFYSSVRESDAENKFHFRDALRIFIENLTTASLTSLFTAIAVCGAAILSAVIFLKEDVMLSPSAAVLAQDPLDDYEFGTSQALRLMRSPPQGPHLALIGTAAMRETLTADDDIAGRLARGLGRPMPVIDFMSGGQSGIEMAAYADSLGRDFQGVVVLGVSFSRLAADSAELAKLVDEPRLAFVSPAADAEIRAAGFAVPARTGNYFIDNYKFFVARYRTTLWHLLTGKAPVHATRTYLGRPPADARQWASDAAILKARTAHYDDRADNNLGAMERLVRMFPDRSKVKIVLLEIPLNPRAEREVLGSDFVARHRARMQAFAQKEGVLYWDLNQSAGLTPADFQDWAHVNTASGQDRWTTQLIDRLLPLLQSK
jgi:hypothetical protein